MIKRNKMKRYLIFGLVFLMAGCEASGGDIMMAWPTIPTIEKTEVKKVPPPKEPKIKEPTINALTTSKPILCANQKEVFQHLMKLGELPLASWTDAQHMFPVILFMNTETGGASVIEIPSLDKGTFRGLVCFISTGVNSVIKPLTKSYQIIKSINVFQPNFFQF